MTTRPRGSGLRVVVPATVFAAAIVAIVVLAAVWVSGSAAVAARAAVASPPAVADAASSPQPAAPADPGGGSGGAVTAPLPGQPLRLQVPAVGLDATVRAMARPSSGDIDPPGSWAAYWISSYGQAGPAADNTAYIAGHTCRGTGCHAVFSPFLDVPHSTTTVHPGDAVIVTTPSGTWHYTVTGTELYDKATIADNAQLWQAVPGRLVLITCFQYAGGTSSQQNYIVYAALDPGQ